MTRDDFFAFDALAVTPPVVTGDTPTAREAS